MWFIGACILNNNLRKICGICEICGRKKHTEFFPADLADFAQIYIVIFP